MEQLRHLAHRHRLLAFWLVAMALAVSAIVPRGYMVAPGESFTVTLCSSMGPATVQVDIPMEGGQQEQGSDDRGKGTACPYAGMGAMALPAADPVLLAAAIAFVLALGSGAVAVPAIGRPPHVQPPPIGPPARI